MTTTDEKSAAKRVLIIDDSPFILEATKAALTDIGLEVQVAQDLREFETQCRGQHDLILIDIQMPEAFGDDLAMMLRGSRQVRTPIFFLSSLPDEELKQRAEEAAVDGYISKRSGIEAMVKRVQEILAETPPLAGNHDSSGADR
jgi:DNA-binding response OmpR family regulator